MNFGNLGPTHGSDSDPLVLRCVKWNKDDYSCSDLTSSSDDSKTETDISEKSYCNTESDSQEVIISPSLKRAKII